MARRVQGNPAGVRHDDGLLNLALRYPPARPQQTFPVFFSDKLIAVTLVERNGTDIRPPCTEEYGAPAETFKVFEQHRPDATTLESGDTYA